MDRSRPHLKTLEEIERDCIPGLVQVLRMEGIEGVRYALWDMTRWHEYYDPCIWRNRATEKQKQIGWKMWVRMENIIATVLDGAHKATDRRDDGCLGGRAGELLQVAT